MAEAVIIKLKIVSLVIFLLLSSVITVFATASIQWNESIDWNEGGEYLDWNPSLEWEITEQYLIEWDQPQQQLVYGYAPDMGTHEIAPGVEIYHNEIVNYCNQFGIPQFVDLVKAVASQESYGKLTDIMQAAECSKNKWYPRKPNGIQDVYYSWECGIAELADCLRMAGVDNPLDITGIRLALQGYNYGPGYITWALNNYGGYSKENASEFSDMQARNLGWEKYGDKNYVQNVLKFYQPVQPVFSVDSNFVYFSQLDPAWRYQMYGRKETIGATGCGPTSLAMVVSTLTDKYVNPHTMSIWAYENGYEGNGSGSYHGLMLSGAKKWGLTSEGTNDKDKIRYALQNGKLVVAIMGKGDFTKTGHFIVLRGIDPTTGKIKVADPASEYNSKQLWDLDLIHSQAKWSASGPFWIMGGDK